MQKLIKQLFKCILIVISVYLTFINIFIGIFAFSFTIILVFFIKFEDKKPQARDIMPIAVMSAITVTGRIAFSFLPQFTPTLALIILTGMIFGANTGFLTGAFAMLVSNIFLGHGP